MTMLPRSLKSLPILLVTSCVLLCCGTFAPGVLSERPHSIVIDGDFSDWEGVPAYTDPDDAIDGSVLHDGVPDCHDTVHEARGAIPEHVYNEDVNILEYRFTHDRDHLYAYIRVKGEIGRTSQIGQPNVSSAGRCYVIATIDVDENEATGYCTIINSTYIGVKLTVRIH